MLRALILLIFTLAQAAHSDDRAIESFVLINADNDLVTVDGNGKTLHQGEEFFKTLHAAGLRTTSRSALHILIDSNSLVSGPGFEQTRLVHCSNGTCMEEQLTYAGGETDLTDLQVVQRLFARPYFSENVLKTFTYWGHGNGFAPVPSYDHSSPEKPFSPLTMAPLLKNAGIGLVIFDACAMASLEVLAQLENHVRYVIASPYNLPVEGLQWNRFGDLLGGAVEAELAERSLEFQLFQLLFRETGKLYSKTGAPFGLILFDTTGLQSALDALNPLVPSLKADKYPDVYRISKFSEMRVSVTRFIRAAAEAINSDPMPVIQSIHKLALSGYGPITMTAPENFQPLQDGKLKREIFEALNSSWTRKFETWNLLRTLEGTPL